MAIYQGADTMKAERAQKLWDITEGKKRHEKETADVMGDRALLNTIGDIWKKVDPGTGHIFAAGIEQGAQHLYKMPEYEEDPSFWGASEIAELKEQDVAFRRDADASMLESVMGQFEDYAGTDVGAEALSSLFAREGGRVPKYENGGKTGGRAPKKEDIEGFKALYDLFSKGQPTVKSGKPMFTEEGGYSKDYFAEELGLNPEEMSIDTLSYQDPRNFEFEITGDGRKIDLSQKGNIWPRRSTYDKKEREMRSDLRENIGDENYMRVMSELNPDGYDTLLKKVEDKYFDMDRFKQMDYDMKNFKGGGRVPKYKNGGEVEKYAKMFESPKSAVSGLESTSGKKISELLAEKLNIALDPSTSSTVEYGGEKHIDRSSITIADIISGLEEGKGIKDRWTPGWDDPEIGGGGIGGSMQRDSEKGKGLMALLQRLLPGGKTGMKEYAGGGIVESGSPTIAGYFSQQGKTLGGSNIQSLTEKLGRK